MTRIGSIALALLPLAEGLARACPNCIGDTRYASLLRAGAVFMLLPFALCGLVIWGIRRAQREVGAPVDAPAQPEAVASGTVAADGTPTATE